MDHPSATPRTTTGTSPWRPRLAHVAAGAACGLILWMCAILLGIPRLAGMEGHDFTPVAALVGGLFGLTRLRTWTYVKTALVVALVAVVAYTPLIDGPAQSLVRRDAPLAGSAPAGAVVVLAASISADSLLDQQALDRLLAGAALVKDGAAPRLVITRNTVRVGRRRIPSTPDQWRIIRLAGIDPAQVLVVDSVRSTRDEAVRAWALLAPQGIRRVVVVTSPAHTGRACRTFQRVGFSVVCTPSESRDVPFTRGTLTGSADRLDAFGFWLYEQAARQYYHLKGWI